MRTGDLMEKNIRKISIDKDQLLVDAIELMRKQNLSILLCTNENKLAGILTERELADRLGSSKSKTIKASSLHVSTSMYYKPRVCSLTCMTKVRSQHFTTSQRIMTTTGGRDKKMCRNSRGRPCSLLSKVYTWSTCKSPPCSYLSMQNQSQPCKEPVLMTSDEKE